jgi:RNA polymerase primary sigma factor
MYIHLESVAAPLRDMIIDKDRFDNPNDVLVEEMIHDDVQEFLKKTLTQRELQVIEMRFGLLNRGKVTSLEDIGTILGISASRAAQIEEQAMEKLKNSYTNRQVETYLEEANSEVEND